jgi:hypothetical protein
MISSLISLLRELHRVIRTMAEWPTHKNMMMLPASKVIRTPALTNKADKAVKEDVAVMEMEVAMAVVVKDLLMADVKEDVGVAVTTIVSSDPNLRTAMPTTRMAEMTTAMPSFFWIT